MDILRSFISGALLHFPKISGQMSHSYSYDPLYRLASATGTYKGTDNKAASYTLSIDYDNMHRITSKKQDLTQTGVQFDKNGVLNHRLLSKYEGSSDNFSALKTLSESSTNYLFNVSDKDINGKAFFEKGTNRDYPNNYLYGITNLPNAENEAYSSFCRMILRSMYPIAQIAG